MILRIHIVDPIISCQPMWFHVAISSVPTGFFTQFRSGAMGSKGFEGFQGQGGHGPKGL